MSPANPVRLAVELSDSEAMELALLAKRLRFDQVAELTECWQPVPQREDQAYRMLGALERVAKALRDTGYAPR